MNYPNIFRKIYNSETHGKKGFFSIVQDVQDNKYKNSKEYNDYLKSLTENQKFILNKVFDIKQKFGISYTMPISSYNITEDMSMTYACFNGSTWSSKGGNLERYLKLITNMAYPIKTGQHKFYINCKDEILSNKTIKEVLDYKEFSFSESESRHKQLWRVLVNSNPNQYTSQKSKEVIYYDLNNLHQYSLLEIKSIDVGLRNSIIFFIVKLLDQVGWIDEFSRYSNNTDENVVKIAELIYGENVYDGKGVLDILGKIERGVSGLYDLMLFCLYCCQDRGGDIFNLTTALSKHGNWNAPTSGNVKELVVNEMRELSQKIFERFKSHYIENKKNIFNEIDKLRLEDVCGKYFNYIDSKMKSGKIKNLEEELSKMKSSMKSFIIYQLGNINIGSGIGCGYYDISGNEDEKGIRKALNKYLFEYCFNPKENENNYIHFLDYLLINCSNSYGSYSPHINEFTKVLDKDLLAQYWQKQSR